MVTNISPKDSPFYSMIGSTTMVARLKENVNDVVSGGTAINALSEGDTLSAAAVTNRTVESNYSQIFTKVFSVSRTQERVEKYGGVSSEKQYQLKQAMIAVAKDVEYSFMNGTASAGQTGTGSASARWLGGLKSKITTNTATASGAAATGTAFEAKLNDLLEKMFDTGQEADTIFVEGTIKRRISGLTANVTRNVNAAEKKQIQTINIYDSDFGTVDIVLDRYVPDNYLFAVKMDYFKTAYLDSFQTTPLAKTSDSMETAIVGELTLDIRSEKAGGRLLLS
jgi:hypothetical protein